MIDLPRWDALAGDRQRCVADVESWARALVGTGVVGAFDRERQEKLEAADVSSDGVWEALESFAAEHWDFRGGRERNLAAAPSLTDEQSSAIVHAARLLGLAGTPSPTKSHYDAVLMTGGMVRAGIVKPRFLRELTDAGLQWREGVFLGTFRRFAGDEVELAHNLGVEGDDEFEAMAAGMRRAFDLGEPAARSESGGRSASGRSAGGSHGGSREDSRGDSHEDSRGDWREDCWAWRDRTLRVIAAPSLDPGRRRANTADTFRFWAGRAGAGIRSVLVVTTPVYVPYQGAVAIEVLGLDGGFAVETVSVSDAASDLGEFSQVFGPSNQAQELRSAIHGLRGLRARLV